MEPRRRPTLSRDDLPWVAALALLGCAALLNISALPVFEDEGSQQHLIWRLLGAHEWLQALLDGKPLEVWLMAPLADLGLPAVAMARLAHVLVGIGVVVLTYMLALRTGGRVVARASALLVAVCPFVVYLERLALADILLCAASTWVLLCAADIVCNPDRRRARNLAVALVLAALCKLPVGFVLLTCVPLALLCVPRAQRQTLLSRPCRVPLLLAHVPVLACAAAVVSVALVRWHHGHAPGFGFQDLVGIASGRTGDIAGAMGLARPTLLGELGAQLGLPVLATGFAGVVLGGALGGWRTRWLLAAGALPMLVIVLFAHFWYSRYLLFTLPPLFIVAVTGWRELCLRAGRAGGVGGCVLLALCAASMGWQSARLIVDPPAARWSDIDRFQYFDGWGAGYGYREAAHALQAAAFAGPVYALDGHSAQQLLEYLPRDWRSRVRTLSDIAAPRSTAVARLDQVLADAPVWFVVPEPLLQRSLAAAFGPAGVQQLALRPIARFAKPRGSAPLGLYEATRVPPR